MAKKSLKSALRRHEVRKTQDEREKSKEKHLELQELAKKKKIAPKHWWNPHNPDTLSVFLGEADFGFTRACLEETYINQVIATNYDSEAEIISKYPNSTDNLDFLRTDARVDALHFGVDATALQSNKPFYQQLLAWQKENPAECIDFIFNFPHLGASIKDMDRNIRAHQQFLCSLFDQVRPLKARLMLTLFEGEPYDSWQIKALARSHGFRLFRSGAFDWSKYPSYSHCLTAKHGNTSKKQHERKARVYIFVKQDPSPEKESK